MKWVKNSTIVIMALVVLVILQSITGSTPVSASTDDQVFVHDQVVDVNIDISPEDYQDLVDNAMEEKTYMADITFNGQLLTSVGIRAKGNSSLKQVANSDSERYSFKIDFDEYIDEQSLFGLSKINLNNIFSDPSMMAEYLSYEMLASIGADAPRTTYVNLSINGHLHGLYLAVEQVDENFLIDHFGNASGELYKPDMGQGSDLVYSEDANYTGIFDELGASESYDHFQDLLYAIEHDQDLSEVMNVDSFLKYMAVSTMVVHFDSYQGGMFHNYYLYYNDGLWEWIAWDLNMTFNGFPMSGLTDLEATQALIDEPVTGSMDQYPLVQAVFENEDYLDQYHDYLEELVANYLEEETFTQKVTHIYEMISPYVAVDPTAFFTPDEFKEGVYGDLGTLDFMSLRVQSVLDQLNGQTASTNGGNGNVGTGGKSGGPGQKPMDNQPPENNQGQKTNQGQKANQRQKPGDQTNNQGQMQAANTSQLLNNLKLITDIPDDILTSLEGGVMPEREVMDNFINSLSQDQQNQVRRLLQENMQAGMNQRPGMNQNPDTQEIEVQESQPRDQIIVSIGLAFILLIVGYLVSRIKK